MKRWFAFDLRLLIFIFSPAPLFLFHCSQIQFSFLEPMSYPHLPPFSHPCFPAYQRDIHERIKKPAVQVEVGSVLVYPLHAHQIVTRRVSVAGHGAVF
ncbi:hypothetical protein BJ165DRAFT_1503646 [Panaeolus papilionaceus]|nr:hypothetical protein BJ165DRAFT_1503646 [Panaeolus papilionaceus]